MQIKKEYGWKAAQKRKELLKKVYQLNSDMRDIAQTLQAEYNEMKYDRKNS